MHKRLQSLIIIIFMTVSSACGGRETTSGVTPPASTDQVSNESKEQITESEGAERTADISETVYNVALKYVSLTDEYFSLKIELDEYTDKMERLAASLDSVTGHQELPNDEFVLDDMDNLLESAKNGSNQDIQLWYSALKVDLGLLAVEAWR